MNDIERAIKQFNNFKQHGYKSSYLPSNSSIEFAIQALDEITEQESKCNGCTQYRTWSYDNGLNARCDICKRNYQDLFEPKEATDDR